MDIAKEFPMTLARALQVKNKLAGELKLLQNRVSTYNSYRVDRPPEYSAMDAFTEWQAKLALFIDLKAAIAKANIKFGLYPKIVKRDELKGTIKFLQSIPTLRGRHDVNGGYGYGARGDSDSAVRELEYECCLGRKDVDELIKGAEDELDQLQQDLARLNHETLITSI